ncbi:dihydroorotate dehydrogenase [Phycisphaerales bacterium AB-hyl4]|uniref:Dihydroorotate dehydrogenase n=1 Tax=Natronomicrosphaera hydrolytica TaxID=3242702 RepID=A0ABV4U8A2_9BACT
MNQAPPTTDAGPSMAVNLAGLELANPMMTASGTCGYAYEYADFVDLSKFGAFVTKSITAETRAGNPAHRIVETRGGMLNAIGLANVGHAAFMRDKLPQLVKMRETGPRIIVNVAGHSVDDYVSVAGNVAGEAAVDAIELNVSCPNVKDGLTFGTNPKLLKDLIAEVASAMDKQAKLIVKLSPNVEDITATARAAVEGGADVLSLINTYTAMAIDIHTRKPRIANGTGGLSGPAVRPLAVYLTSRVYREVARDAGVPLIGMGGIQYWQDAVEFLLAGATGLAVGTALFVDPATPLKVLDGVQAYLKDQGCTSIDEIIGQLEMPGDPPRTPYP